MGLILERRPMKVLIRREETVIYKEMVQYIIEAQDKDDAIHMLGEDDYSCVVESESLEQTQIQFNPDKDITKWKIYEETE